METTPKKKLVKVTLIVAIVGLAIVFLAPYVKKQFEAPVEPLTEQFDSLATKRDSLKVKIDSLNVAADSLKKKPI